ncbi:hypothetical protein [Pontibacter roseus]|uniref:hypothetical protein n=1 Tax=Pontibacter roseus TaxID=336989 RepID=UPI00036EE3A7|nr:hypothetical protein [Pontibacter roseus]
MNRDRENRNYGQHEGDFHTHRSDRYRHPESDSNYGHNAYGSSARGGYGHQGNYRAGGRGNYSNINITDSDTYSTSRNYGNMGSYGGAQGFGDIRGGRHTSDHPFDSGMGSSQAYMGRERERETDRGDNPRGYSSFGNESYSRGGSYGRGQSGYGGRNQEDLYGHDTSRRFQGSAGQSRYDFERDDYYSSNYGDDQGNYMGGGYHRMTQSNYGAGDYGSSGHMERGNQGRDIDRDMDRERGGSRNFNTAQNRWNTDW